MSLLDTAIASIMPQEAKSRAAAKARLEQLTMPYWALGNLMDLALDLAGITGSITPPVSRKTIVTMAGDHGVVAEGVSKYPAEVTPQMVANIAHGGAGINALAGTVGAEVVVVDMGVTASLLELGDAILHRKIAQGTANIADGPAMSREQAVCSIETGIEVAQALSSTTDVYGTGDMGIGNTTPSTAIVSVLTGLTVSELTGHGTGIDDTQRKRKVQVIEKALAVNNPDSGDGIDILAKVGGFEIGGIAGLIIGAASLRKPVVIDGFISTAGALIAHQLSPTSAEFMIAAHKSVEQGHQAMLERLGKTALLDLNLRLGEGTGAALAMPLIDAAVAILTRIATFDEAAVSEANQ